MGLFESAWPAVRIPQTRSSAGSEKQLSNKDSLQFPENPSIH